MSTISLSLVVFACVFVAALFGMLLRRLLPEHHRSSETKDTVRLAMGFVATMAALVLGLLVASAKDSYDKQSAGVTQIAAKVVYLDRLLASFGPETKEARALFRLLAEQVTKRMWPDEATGDSQLDPSASHSEAMISAIQSLEAKNDLQSTLKARALSTCLEIGEMRWLEYAQADTRASLPLVCILVFWTAVLFASFGLFAPSNGTVVAALALGALSVAVAIFLMLELRTPFSGLLQIPDTAFVNAISHLEN